MISQPPRGRPKWKRSLPKKHWDMTPHVLDVDECLSPKVSTEVQEVGHLLQAGIEHWSVLTQEMVSQPLHILLFM